MQEIVDAALRRQRATVLIALGVGLGTGLLLFWAKGVGGFVALLAPLPALAFVVLTLWHLFRAPGTAELRVDPGSRSFFSAPRRLPTLLAVLSGWLAFQAVDGVRQADEDRVLVLLAALAALVCVMSVLVSWSRVPFVAVTPEGLSIGAPRPQAVVPWVTLDQQAPARPPNGIDTVLRLTVTRPELTRRAGWWARKPFFVPVRELEVAPALLVDAIRYYVAHPEHRAAIGTPEEYARLRQALTAGR
ncbi:hypothetical protein [Micromonospora auratinigra]|uniref:PH domain-containing protein n=1 Tax=Micromonospora auratinigra TaxID=261654 RepID=A0A1A9A5S0_9ACTN|nr:hypothetical protein [Micromonospora auratinigra]SBT51539.1 hypothetical protein GA0070611_5222 [Micromonospora auratinigra]